MVRDTIATNDAKHDCSPVSTERYQRMYTVAKMMASTRAMVKGIHP